MQLNSRPGRGFTIIELMVVIAIVAIVVMLSMPSFSGMIQNSKLSSAARSYLAGIQTARTEAIRRNLPVEFVLTDTPVVDGVENSAVATTTGKNWIVRSPIASVPGTYESIDKKSVQESNGNSISVAGAATAPATFTGVLTFSGMGGTAGGETVVLNVGNPSGGDCAPAGAMRCQRILVRPGGQITMCDPAAAAADARACPF